MPAVDDMLSPATRGEKADAPHQSPAMNRKRESWIGTSKLHGLHRLLARNKIHQKAEIAGEVAKRPGDQSDVQVQASSCTKVDPECRASSSSIMDF